jgi:PhzF family phenazine biosynthesis protein
MDIQRIAAFAEGGRGGNPAGIVLADAALPVTEMARAAAEIGYSETAFAHPEGAGWRVRYFSPESEVPFCGHATIALGAALGARHGAGRYALTLNHSGIAVEAGDGIATLTSPPTRSRPATEAERAEAMALFGLTGAELDPALPPARIHAGADHVVLALRDRARLAAMAYDLDAGREVMRRHGLVTVMLVHMAADHVAARNAFASGGVLEDPATGAAAAAFAGYLRDLGRTGDGRLTIRQGEDMGVPSRIEVVMDDVPGAPVRVTGAVRWMG